jgi:hypothetical protein
MKAYYPKNQKDDLRFNIYKSGVVADLTISEWGARAKLNPEDLGMDSVPELIKLGHKELMKKEYLDDLSSLFSKVKRFLDNHSFVFPFGTARFIPNPMVEEVVQFMEEADKEFRGLLEEFLADYDARRDEMIKEYREVFEKMLVEKYGHDIDNGVDYSPEIERDVDELITQLEAKYPSKEELRGKFNIDFVMFEIALPELTKLGSEEAVEKARREAELASIYKKRAVEKIDTFLDNVIGTLKGKVLEITKHMKGRLDAGNLNQVQIKSFVRFANEFKKQDFVGMELDAVIEGFKEKLSNADKESLKDEEFNNKLKADLAEIEDKVINSDKSKILDKYLRRIEVGDGE